MRLYWKLPLRSQIIFYLADFPSGPATGSRAVGAEGCCRLRRDVALKINQVGIPISEPLHWGQAQMSLRWQRGPSFCRNVQEKRSLVSIQHQVTSHSQGNTLGQTTESRQAGLQVSGQPGPSADGQAACPPLPGWEASGGHPLLPRLLVKPAAATQGSAAQRLRTRNLAGRGLTRLEPWGPVMKPPRWSFLAQTTALPPSAAPRAQV